MPVVALEARRTTRATQMQNQPLQISVLPHTWMDTRSKRQSPQCRSRRLKIQSITNPPVTGEAPEYPSFRPPPAVGMPLVMEDCRLFVTLERL